MGWCGQLWLDIVLVGVMFGRIEVRWCCTDLLQQELLDFRSALVWSCFTMLYMGYVVGLFFGGKILWSSISYGPCSWFFGIIV